MKLTTRQQECTREIPLTKGLVALVDAEDFDKFNLFRWQAFKSGNGWYAVRRIQIRSAREPGGQAHKMLWLHREIMAAQRGQTVDHANRNTLDNRRQNLRFCTIAQNVANGRPRRPGFRGVYVSGRKWIARISKGAKFQHLGTFETAEAAARAYDAAAKMRHGEFASLNFPHGDFS